VLSREEVRAMLHAARAEGPFHAADMTFLAKQVRREGILRCSACVQGRHLAEPDPDCGFEKPGCHRGHQGRGWEVHPGWHEGRPRLVPAAQWRPGILGPPSSP
jgi:hypothetical protein